MQSKYWQTKWKDAARICVDNNEYEIVLFDDGSCGISMKRNAYQEPNFIDVLDASQFVAMMQEAHELARQHFGEQWGKQG